MNDITAEGQAAADALNRDIPSRIIRDIVRKTPVIILIPGEASISLDTPKFTVTDRPDLLRVARQLDHLMLAIVQAKEEMIVVLDQFATLVGARIYTLTDLPDLSILSTDRLITNRYEVLSYHYLPEIVKHLQTISADASGLEKPVEFSDSFSENERIVKLGNQ